MVECFVDNGFQNGHLFIFSIFYVFLRFVLVVLGCSQLYEVLSYEVTIITSR